MTCRTICIFCFGGVLLAQQAVTPTPEPAEPQNPDTIGDYTLAQSFAVGYRALSVTGNDATYQSQVNYGNGLRLFGGDLEASSKDGDGLLFDQLSLKAEGLGNDPYEWRGIQSRKARLVRIRPQLATERLCQSRTYHGERSGC